MPRITVAQLNYRVGDIAGNVAKMVAAARDAGAAFARARRWARVRGMIARNEYKRRQASPIIRVRSRAFGSGRQMPIAAMLA